MAAREIEEVRTARATHDGDGVAIQRISGMRHPAMDPFLLKSDLPEEFIGGFPPHPHRGMQTLTYLKHGGIVHEDSLGNRGEISGGGAQWMSAGRGVIHSEMPRRDSEGLHGFQIWINLPAAEKMSPPQYRDIPRAALDVNGNDDFQAAAISGSWRLGQLQLQGPLRELETRASVLDLTLKPGVMLDIPTPTEESAIAYVYEGGLAAGGEEILAQQLLISTSGDSWALKAGGQGAGILFLRGEPLREPVVNYGPFVMNTQEEIEQARKDYQSGQFV